MDVDERDPQEWFYNEKSLQVEVRLLYFPMFWVRTSSDDYSRMVNVSLSLNCPLLCRLDHWTEVLGPVLKPSWIQMEGIPLHAWDVKVFSHLGECLGVVMHIDEDAIQKKRLDKVKVLILRDPQRRLPTYLVLDVESVRFKIAICKVEDCNRAEVQRSTWVSRREPVLSETVNPILEEKNLANEGILAGALKSIPLISANATFFGGDLATVCVKEDARMNVSTSITESAGQKSPPKKKSPFRRTRGRNREANSCPTIRGIYKKLRKDLNTPLEILESNFLNKGSSGLVEIFFQLKPIPFSSKFRR